MNKLIFPLFGVTLFGFLSVGCSDQKKAEPAKIIVTKPASESKILSIYDQLKAGMNVTEVEAIAGEPLLKTAQPDGKEEYWYVNESEREMKPHESPWGPFGIHVSYQDGKLIEKKYNFQWVDHKHQEAYRKLKAKKEQP